MASTLGRITCEQCGQLHTNERFCSVECKHEYGRVEVECAGCGTPMERIRAWAERDQYHYCSECRYAERVEVTCRWCGTTVEVQCHRKESARYCSPECTLDAGRAERWGHGTPFEQVREVKEDAGRAMTRDALAAAVPCVNVERALDHAIEQVGGIGWDPATAEAVVATLREDGPLTRGDLSWRYEPNSLREVLRRLEAEQVVVNLGPTAGGYNLVESLPPVARPRGWSPPEWAAPLAPDQARP